jgi:hypothetical protein
MESLKTTLSYWPQALVFTAMVISVIGGWLQDGKPMKDPVIHGRQITWIVLWYALVLGMGGFWK